MPFRKNRGPRRTLPFGTRLSVSYLLVTSVAVFSLGVFGSATLIDENKRVVGRLGLIALERSYESIKYRMQDMERLSDQLLINADFQKLLSGKSFGASDTIALRRDVLPVFTQAVQRTPLRLSVAFLFTTSAFPTISFDPMNSNPMIRGNFIEIGRLDPFSSLQDRNELARFPTGRLSWDCSEEDAELGMIAFGRQIIELDSLRNFGVMRGRVEMQSLFEPIRGVEEELFRVLAEDGRVLYPLGSDAASRAAAADGLVFSREIEGTPWRLELLIPRAALSRGAGRIVIAAALASIVVFLLSASFGLLFARTFKRRIEKVSKSIRAMEAGDFKTRVDDDRDDEFGAMVGAFNSAAETIDGLIRKVYDVELEKKDAELRLLQAQINPHFLYNSLSSISRLSRMGRSELVHQFVLDLAKFYRLALNEGRECITVREELDRLDAYMRLQGIKHEGRLSSTITMSAEVADFHIPHLILQPFVENAVEHAWRCDRLSIHVRAELRDGVMLLAVEDDGSGMTEEQVRNLLSQTEPSYGYGIYNVRTRLRLQYGEDAVLSIESVPDAGTKIGISILAAIGA